jgi:hypothetical protein
VSECGGAEEERGGDTVHAATRQLQVAEVAEVARDVEVHGRLHVRE